MSSDAGSNTSLVSSQASTEVMVGITGNNGVEPDLKDLAIHNGDGKCCTCSVQVAEGERCLVRASAKNQPYNVWRCKPCHALKSRINRIMNKNGNLARDWTEMSEADRSKFIADNKNLYGAELEVKITETVQIVKTKKSTTAFSAEGIYKTEQQIRDAWVKEPHIADNIIANGRNFFDQVKKVYLYEDTSFKAKTEDEETRSEAHRFTIEAGPNAIVQEQKGGTDGPKGQTRKRAKGNEDAAEGKPVKVSKTDKSFAKKFISSLGNVEAEDGGAGAPVPSPYPDFLPAGDGQDR